MDQYLALDTDSPADTLHVNAEATTNPTNHDDNYITRLESKITQLEERCTQYQHALTISETFKTQLMNENSSLRQRLATLLHREQQWSSNHQTTSTSTSALLTPHHTPTSEETTSVILHSAVITNPSSVQLPSEEGIDDAVAACVAVMDHHLPTGNDTNNCSTSESLDITPDEAEALTGVMMNEIHVHDPSIELYHTPSPLPTTTSTNTTLGTINLNPEQAAITTTTTTTRITTESTSQTPPPPPPTTTTAVVPIISFTTASTAGITRSDEKWEQHFQKLVQYKNEHGNCLVPTSTELGRWLCRQRHVHRNDKGLKDERRIRLQELDETCLGDRLSDISSPATTTIYDHDQNTHGNTTDATTTTTPLLSTKTKYNQAYESKLHEKWDAFFQQLVDYKSQHGHCNFPTMNGSLGRWISRQRTLFRKHLLKSDRYEKLIALGFKFEDADAIEFKSKLDDQWDDMFALLVEHRKAKGHCFDVPESMPLGKWLYRQRWLWRQNSLREDRATKLLSIQFDERKSSNVEGRGGGGTSGVGTTGEDGLTRKRRRGSDNDGRMSKNFKDGADADADADNEEQALDQEDDNENENNVEITAATGSFVHL